MELDESAVEREKLVNELEEDEDENLPNIQPSQSIPSTTTTSVGVAGKMSKSSTGSVKLNRSGSTGRADPGVASSGYREPVVIVSNAMQKAAPETVTSSSVATPVSPGLNNHRGIFSSGDTSRRSQNSTKSHRNSTTTGSGTIVGSGTGGPGSSGAPQSTRLVFVNERTGSAHSSTGAGKLNAPSTTTNASSDKNIKPRKMQRDPATPSNLPPRPPQPPSTLNHSKSVSAGGSFSDRALKHHSFLSEVPDVRHMERALLGLLDDFHSGKLRAFGSSGTMEQMTNIREQQERLAKLHFELGGVHNMMMSDEDNNGADNENETIAQENMTRLVKQLEQLSVSIEGLQGNSDAL